MSGAIPDPAAIMAWLDQAAGELDRLGKDLEAAHLDLGDAETEYESKLDEALLLVVDEHDGKRLPGEDVRLAMARRRMDFDVYVRFRKAKRRVEGLRSHCRLLETAVTARQSTLKGMREEAALHQAGYTGRAA